MITTSMKLHADFLVAYAKLDGHQESQTEHIRAFLKKLEEICVEQKQGKEYLHYMMRDKSSVAVKYVEIGKPELGIEFKVFNRK